MTQEQQQHLIQLKTWQQQLRHWVPQLTQLVGQQQWQAIGLLAREMEPKLATLNQYPEVRASFVRELGLLKQLCQLAWKGAAARSQELERAMSHLRDNREGLRAYQEAQQWA
jgi:hypothetical protein